MRRVNMAKEKSDLFRKTEYALYNYKTIDLKIKNIEIDIECLKNDISIKAINYEEKVGPTNAFNSSVENEVIKREEKVAECIERLEAEKFLLVCRKAKIENALKSLADTERKIIELKYFTKPKRTWLEIGLAVNMDKDHCRRKGKKLIHSLSDYIFRTSFI